MRGIRMAWIRVYLYFGSIKLIYVVARTSGQPLWICVLAALYQALTQRLVKATIEFGNGNHSARKEHEGS